jgi:hypothetical protein
MPQPKES